MTDDAILTVLGTIFNIFEYFELLVSMKPQRYGGKRNSIQANKRRAHIQTEHRD